MLNYTQDILRTISDSGWEVAKELPSSAVAAARYLELVAPFHQKTTVGILVFRAATPLATSYRVSFQNLINETLQEIALFWQYPGQTVQFDRAQNLAFNQSWTFTLGPCDPGLTYSIGVFWSGGFHKHPAQGVITPATVPDGDPCADAWVITAQFLQSTNLRRSFAPARPGQYPVGGEEVKQTVGGALGGPSAGTITAAKPFISVAKSGSSFTISGNGFTPGATVRIRAADDFFHEVNANQSADGNGSLNYSWSNLCSGIGAIHFSATDGRPDPNDLTGFLWSNTSDSSCP